MRHGLPMLLMAVLQTANAHADYEQQCNLQSAPADAEVIASHGTNFISYPANLPEDHSGCSYMWLEDGRKLFSAYHTEGRLIWMKGKEPKADKETVCFYEAGQLVEEKSKNSAHCPTL